MKTPQLILRDFTSHGSSQYVDTKLNGLTNIRAKTGHIYSVIEQSSGTTPHGVVIKKKVYALVVEIDGEPRLEIADFYVQGKSATFDVFTAAETTHIPSAAVGETDGVVWQATQDDALNSQGTAEPSLGVDGWSLFSMNGWQLGGIGLAVAGVAAATHDSGGGNDSPQQTSTPPTPVVTTVSGDIVAGPLVTGHGLSVRVFKADGVTVLGSAAVDASGHFSLDVGDYHGVVIIEVVDADAGSDYLDEASAVGKDLNAALFGIGVIAADSDALHLNVNPLTTIAYLKALELSNPPDDASVAAALGAIAQLFGLADLNAIEVVTFNGDTIYNTADGISAGELYGALLAALSGADSTLGGASQATINALVTGITLTNGVATLDAAAQALLIDGADITGVNAAGVISQLIDTIAPLAPALAEFGSDHLGDGIVNIADAATTTLRIAIADTGAVAGDRITLLLNVADFSTPQAVTLTSDDIANGYVDKVLSVDVLGEDGSKALSARVIDRAGNAGAASAALTFDYDGHAPAALTLTLLNDGGISNSDRITDDGRLQVTGRENGASIEYSNDGNVWVESFTALEGDNTVYVRQVDTVGNISPQTALDFRLDTLTPTAPTPAEFGSALLTDGVMAAAQSVQLRVDLVNAGANAGDQIDLLLDGTALLTPKSITLSVNDISVGYVTFTVATGDLGSDGAKSLSIRITDAVGHVSALSDPLSFALDTTGPSAPTITEFGSTDLADNRLNAAEGISTVFRVSIASTGAVADDSLALLLNSHAFATPKTVTLSAQDISNGYVDFTVTDDDLGTNGSRSLTARLTDQAGNAGTLSAALTFAYDSRAPQALTAMLVSDTGADSGDRVSSDGSLSLLGTESGATLEYSTNGTSWTSSFTAAEGANTVYVRQTDLAGNVSASSTALTFTVDTLASNAPLAIAEHGSSDLTDSTLDASEAQTTDFRITLPTTGVALVAGDTLEVLLNAVAFATPKTYVLTPQNISDGYVDVTIDDAELGTDGAKSLTAQLTDIAGNASAASASLDFTVDRSVMLGGQFMAGPALSSNGLRVSAFDSAGHLIGTGSVGSDSNFSITLTQNYTGLVLVRVDDVSPGADYVDEATGQGKDLAADLRAIITVNGAGAYTVNVTPLTELVVRQLGLAGGNEGNSAVSLGSVAPSAVTAANNAVAAVVGLQGDLATMPIAPTIDAGGNVTHNANPYGLALAGVAALETTGHSLLDVLGSLQGAVADPQSASTLISRLESNIYSVQASNADTQVSVEIYQYMPDIYGHARYVFEFSAPVTDFGLDQISFDFSQGFARTEVRYLREVSPTTYELVLNSQGHPDTTVSVAAGVVTTAQGATNTASVYRPMTSEAVVFDLVSGHVTNDGVRHFDPTVSYDIYIVVDGLSGHVAAPDFIWSGGENLGEDDNIVLVGSGGQLQDDDAGTGGGGLPRAIWAQSDGPTDQDVLRWYYNNLHSDNFVAQVFADQQRSGYVLSRHFLSGGIAHAENQLLWTNAAISRANQPFGGFRGSYDAVLQLPHDVALAQSFGTPVFDSATVADAIDERTGANQVVYQSSLQDGTAGVVFSLATGADSALFFIDSHTGAVRLLDNPIYDAKTNYQFTVVATSELGLSQQQTVSLSVVDLGWSDTVAPSMAATGNASIDESAYAGTLVYIARATDTESRPVYSLLSVGDHAAFTIDGNSGAVRLVGVPDYEAQSSYQFTVVATDAGGNTAQQAVTLTVNDTNVENVVVFDLVTGRVSDHSARHFDAGVTYTIYVVAPAGSATLVAPEFTWSGGENLGADDTVVMMGGGGYGNFGGLDAGAGRSYGLASQVIETGTQARLLAPVRGSSPVAAAILGGGSNIGLDRYYRQRQWIPDSSSSHSSSSSPRAGHWSTVVAHGAQALWAQAGGGNWLSNGPQIMLGSSLPTLDAQLQFGAPQFTSGDEATAVEENGSIGIVVYTANAGSNVSYFLQGADASAFAINQTTGQVLLVQSANFEVKSQYQFTVVATNVWGVQTEQPVTLGILDVALEDSTAPVFSSGTAVTTDESAARGVLVYTANATDNQSAVSYALDTSDDYFRFTINSSTGEVRLTAPADVDNQASFTFTVIATDRGGNASSQTVNVAVNDTAIENTVVFDLTRGVSSEHSNRTFDASRSYTIYVVVPSEYPSFVSLDSLWHGGANLGADDRVVIVGNNSTHGILLGNLAGSAAVTQVVAHSQQHQIGFSGVREYTLASGPDQGAYLGAHSNNIRVGRTYVWMPAWYTPQQDPIVRQDARSIWTDARTYDFVSRLNQVSFADTLPASVAALQFATAGSPTFTSGATAAAINENNALSLQVYQAQAGAGITYSLKQAGDHAAFSINAQTGAVTLDKVADFETQSSYSFTVVATDHWGHAVEQAVTLSVLDLALADEVAPAFTSGTQATPVRERESGKVVYSAHVTDDSAVSYHIKPGDDAYYFRVDASGQVRLALPADYEWVSTLHFTLVAVDAYGNASERAVTLQLLDVDEQGPVFQSSTTGVAERGGVSEQIVYRPVVTDASGPVHYGIYDYNRNLFSVDAATGEVRLREAPNDAHVSNYRFQLYAYDAYNNMSAQNVSISLVNDLTAPRLLGFSAENQYGGTPASVYGVGSVIQISATFSENITVGSSMTVTLNTGAVVQLSAPYGGNILSGTYTVAAGENIADLTVASFTNGTVRDTSNNAWAETSLPAGANIGSQQDIAIDTDGPHVTGFTSSTVDGRYGAGSVITITALLSESSSRNLVVTLNTGQTIELYNWSQDGRQVSGSYTVRAGDNAADLTVSSFTTYITEYGGAYHLRDALGNLLTDMTIVAGTNLGDSHAIVVDTQAPAAPPQVGAVGTKLTDGYLSAAEVGTTRFRVDLTGASIGDVITLQDTSSFANPGTGQYRVTTLGTAVVDQTALGIGFMTIAVSDTQFTSGDLTRNISARVTDAAGNAGAASAALSFAVDTGAPAVQSIMTSSANGTYRAGDSIAITVQFTNTQFTDALHQGSAMLATLSNGATITLNQIVGASLSGSYVVQPGDAISSDLTVTRLVAAPGGVSDVAGNALSSVAIPAGRNLGDNANIQIAGVNPNDIVVFDLVHGQSSTHSGRTFQAGHSYTIYVLVDGNTPFDSSFANVVGGLNRWQGGSNLGSDDRIVLVGNGSERGYNGNPIAEQLQRTNHAAVWNTRSGEAAHINGSSGRFYYRNNNGNQFAQLWSGAWKSNPNINEAAGLYLNALPGGILAGQNLLTPDMPKLAEFGAYHLSDGRLNVAEAVSTSLRVTLPANARAGDVVELLLNDQAFASAKRVVLTSDMITSKHIDFTMLGNELGADGTKSLVALLTYADASRGIGAASQLLTFTVDTVAPHITSVAFTGTEGLENNVLGVGDVVYVTVTFDQAVGFGGYALNLDVGGVIKPMQLMPYAPQPATSFTFYYRVDSGAVDADGISIPLNALRGDFGDASGNPALLTHTAVTSVYQVNGVPAGAPEILSVTDNVGTVLGAVTRGGWTDDSTLQVRVGLNRTVVAGNSVTLYSGDTVVKSAVVLTSTDITRGYVDLTSQALGDGTHDLNARLTTVSGLGNASPNFTVAVDTHAPVAHLLSANYLFGANTIVIEGHGFDSLLSGSDSHGTDVKARLDWSKFVWDTKGGEAQAYNSAPSLETSPNITFTLSDIRSAIVGSDGKLLVTLTDTKAAQLEAAPNFDPLRAGDTLDIGNGFLRDVLGNAASHDGAQGLTVSDRSVVVFDLVQGVSSAHSDRTFDANVSYTIYVVVDAHSQNIADFPTYAADPSKALMLWHGGSNLGTDDRIVFVSDDGTGIHFQRNGAPVNHVVARSGAIKLFTPVAPNGFAALTMTAAGMVKHQIDSYYRTSILHHTVAVRDSRQLFTGVWNGMGAGVASGGLANVYTSVIPEGVLAEQHLQPTANAPTFSSGSGGIDVLENSKDQVVYRAAAQDNDFITYSLTGADANHFSIDATTGVVTLLTAFTYDETKLPKYSTYQTYYRFTVVASDGDNATEHQVSGNIYDANDVMPEFVTLSGYPTFNETRSIRENEPVNTALIRVQARDFDATTANNTFTIGFDKAYGDWALLNFDATTGLVTLKNSANYEERDFYSFRMMASDGVNTSYLGVQVNVIDVNEVVLSPTGIAEVSGTKLGDGFINASEDDSMKFNVGLSSRVKAGDVVQLLLNGSPFATAKTYVLNATDVLAQNVVFTVSAADLGSNGGKSLTATVTDWTKTQSPPSGVLTFNYDAVAPQIAFQNGIGVNYSLNENATVYLVSDKVNVTGVASITGAARGLWSSVSGYASNLSQVFPLTSSSLDNGNYYLYAVDAAGNLSARSSTSIALDVTGPRVTAFGSTTANGTYHVGDSIRLTATLDEAAQAYGQITVTLNNGAKVLLTNSISSNQLSGTYVVSASDVGAMELNVASYNGYVADQLGNISWTSALPATNLATAKDIYVSVGPPLSIASDSPPTFSQDVGLYNDDRITNVQVQTLSGHLNANLAAGSVVKVSLDGGAHWQNASASVGSNTWTLANANLLSGENHLQVYVAGANDSNGAVRDYTYTYANDRTAQPVDVDHAIIRTGDAHLHLNESGIVYFIKDGMQFSNLASLDSTKASTLGQDWNRGHYSAGDVTIQNIYKYLSPGTYHAYLRDELGNESRVSDDSFTVLDVSSTWHDNVVVFDTINGLSSDHSNRTFSANKTYQIFILLDSDSADVALNAASAWHGGQNLGADDFIYFVGNEKFKDIQYSSDAYLQDGMGLTIARTEHGARAMTYHAVSNVTLSEKVGTTTGVALLGAGVLLGGVQLSEGFSGIPLGQKVLDSAPLRMLFDTHVSLQRMNGDDQNTVRLWTATQAPLGNSLLLPLPLTHFHAGPYLTAETAGYVANQPMS